MPLSRSSEFYRSSNNDLSAGLSRNRTIRRVKSSTLVRLSSSTSFGSTKSIISANNKPFSKPPTSKMEELQCLAKIKRALRESPSLSHSVSNEMVYRFASFYSFDERASVEAILRDFGNKPQLHLRMTDELLVQFHTGTLFPLPNVMTKDNKNSNVFYMRPSRYFPCSSPNSTRLIIDNLCYVLNDLSKTKADCRKGVAFIANMDGWTMKNFSQDYCFQFMQALQGRMVPTKVQLFLIVNPPKFFASIWKIMKPMLSKSFAKKVRIIKEERLGDFLADGYQEFLPDELACGSRDGHEICEDYIDFKRYEEEQRRIARAQSVRMDCNSALTSEDAAATPPTLMQTQSDGFGRPPLAH